MPKLSDLDVEVLITLPKEPYGVTVPEIAEDVVGRTDSPALGQVRRTLRRFRPWLYFEFVNTRPYGRKDVYGIRADRWLEMQEILTARCKSHEEQP